MIDDSIVSFPLPYDFPEGKAWAAIRQGVVMNMIYMQVPDGISFPVHRNRSRASLAKDGEVWTGSIIRNRFFPAFSSTDIRCEK
jgi:hypothetical protein